MKRRHCHLTDVQIPFTVVLSDWGDPLEDFNHDARWNDYTDVVVEEDVLLSVLYAAWRPTRLADGVERSGDVGELLNASNFSCFAPEDRFATSVLFYDAVIGAAEVLARRIWDDGGVTG